MPAKKKSKSNSHIITPQYIPVDLRSLVAVLKKAAKAGNFEEIIKNFEQVSKEHPDMTLLLPSLLLDRLISQFAFFGLCSGTTGTANITLAAGTVASAARTVSFNYTYTGSPPCSLRVQSVRVSVGGTRMNTNRPTDTGAAWTGRIPAAAGALPATSPATIMATFRKSTTGWCNTCNWGTGGATATANITISP